MKYYKSVNDIFVLIEIASLKMTERSTSKPKASKTCIDNLPNELLSQILACIPLKHDLDNVQRVSKRWYAVVDETIGRDVAITSLTSDDRMNVTRDFPCIPHAHMGCLGFDMISKIGVKTCYVELIDCRYPPGTADDSDEESVSKKGKEDELPNSFKFPHLLKQLYFNGQVTSRLFRSFLSGTENLSLLQINLLALSQLTPEEVKNLQLPRLRSLGVGKCAKAPGINFDDTAGLSQLQSLLQNNEFPELIQLDLRFPIKDFQDLKTIKAIMNFLQVHTVLSELYVIMEFPVRVLHPPQLEQLEEMDLVKNCRNRSKIKICEVQGIRLHASYPQLAVWRCFLEQQQCLQSLTLRLGNLPAILLDQICTKNKASLKHVFLYKLNETIDNDAEGVTEVIEFDCRVFCNVAKLETLYALGCDKVVNVKSLPSSLVSVLLSGALRSDEAEHILFGLPNLQFVSLINAAGFSGENERYGVSLMFLKRFISTRKVKRLILNGTSLCEDYPREGLKNKDPKHPSRLRKFDSVDEDNMYLDWELNTDGYYLDKCY